MSEGILDKSDFTDNRSKEDLALSGGWDFSLLTSTERVILVTRNDDYQRVKRKRAGELGFFPDTMSEEESRAVLLCLSDKELEPYYEKNMIRKKNFWLQKRLSSQEKIMVRKFVCLTYLAEGFSSPVDDPLMCEVKRFGIEEFWFCVRTYYQIMEEQKMKNYESPDYFFSPWRKMQIRKLLGKSFCEKKGTKKLIKNWELAKWVNQMFLRC